MCPRLASFLYVLEGGLWLLSILPPPTRYWDGSHVTPHWGASSRRCGSQERALPMGPHLQPFLSFTFMFLLCMRAGWEGHQCRGRGQLMAMLSPSTMWVLWMELSLPGLAAGSSTHWAISLCTPPPSPFLLVASPRRGRLVVIFLHLDPQENVGLRTDPLSSLSSTKPRDYRAGALFIFAWKIASKRYLLSPQLCLSALPMRWTECSM